MCKVRVRESYAVAACNGGTLCITSQLLFAVVEWDVVAWQPKCTEQTGVGSRLKLDYRLEKLRALARLAY